MMPVLINNNLLTTREDADGSRHRQAAGARRDHRGAGEPGRYLPRRVTIRDNTTRGLPDEAINRQRDDGAQMGVAVRYPRLSADNRITLRNNTISDLRDAGIWLRQMPPAEGDGTGEWVVDGNTIERVAQMVIDHITGRMTVSEPPGRARWRRRGVALPRKRRQLDHFRVVGPGGRGDLGL